MDELRFRQVHLDFHTSGKIPGIGSRFSKEQFKEALKLGHVDSITVFSKCHHGYAYHPSTANEMHPGLDFDLLGAQLEACKEAGVRAPVYLSAGLDEKEAVRHVEWLLRGSYDDFADFVHEAHYHVLCFNTPYLEVLAKQVEEVMERYDPCGIFLDICDVRPCYCQSCLASMREKGLDPKKPEDVRKQAEDTYANYCRRMEQAVRKYSATATIFHNAGHIYGGRRDLANYNTHLELESLPTGGWGYDHFPKSAAYSRLLGKEYLGMTGKFHTSWGEFGGFKHPNALRYETALSLAEGAKCSIGDQLHPTGEMNLATYGLIGKAYAEVEAKEPWCRKVESVADIAFFSVEAFTHERFNPSDNGINRILLEGKYTFDVIDGEEPFDKYRLIILPDRIRIDAALKARLEAFVANGGKLLLTGESGLWVDRDEFALDMGVTDCGESEFCPNYFVPRFETVNGTTSYVMYETVRKLAVEDAEIVADCREPYFNRTPEHFSSHKHTPDCDKSFPAAVINGQIAYIGWKVFADYATVGELHVKELCTYLIERLIGGEKALKVSLPDRGVATLMYQKDENRYVTHLLFAHTTKRGKDVEVIEDIVPLYDVAASIRLPAKPKTVYTVDETGKRSEIEWSWEDGHVVTTLPKLYIHAMIVCEL
ncbi:MAG: beta-galactosidase trimerization domain-containing protein [Clostridia bacterium]|nr:beta-galactosidase trimerization domain-containing protein [Clostridia bacterium]